MKQKSRNQAQKWLTAEPSTLGSCSTRFPAKLDIQIHLKKTHEYLKSKLKYRLQLDWYSQRNICRENEEKDQEIQFKELFEGLCVWKQKGLQYQAIFSMETPY